MPAPTDLTAALLRGVFRHYHANGDRIMLAETEVLAALSAHLDAAPERIVAAAMQIGGLTISLPRPAGHGEVMAQAVLYREWRADGSEIQGFLTSEGRFVTRVEAMKIAHRARQAFVTKQTGPELFSENLW